MGLRFTSSSAETRYWGRSPTKFANARPPSFFRTLAGAVMCQGGSPGRNSTWCSDSAATSAVMNSAPIPSCTSAGSRTSIRPRARFTSLSEGAMTSMRTKATASASVTWNPRIRRLNRDSGSASLGARAAIQKIEDAARVRHGLRKRHEGDDEEHRLRKDDAGEEERPGRRGGDHRGEQRLLLGRSAPEEREHRPAERGVEDLPRRPGDEADEGLEDRHGAKLRIERSERHCGSRSRPPARMGGHTWRIVAPAALSGWPRRWCRARKNVR